MCEGQVGNVGASLNAYVEAMKRDPQFREAHLNYSQMLKEVGRGEESEASFGNTIRLFARPDLPYNQWFYQAHLFRAALRYGLGRYDRALVDIDDGCAIMRQVGLRPETSSLVLGALAEQALGRYSAAIRRFDGVLALEPCHYCWCFREVAIAQWIHLHRPLKSFSWEGVIDPRVKEACCKKQSAVEAGVVVGTYSFLRPPLDEGPDPAPSTRAQNERRAQFNKILELSVEVQQIVQLRSAGFLPNRRQHRMFGLAVLQMASSLRAQLCLEQARRDASGTETGSEVERSGHSFKYREFFDVAVRWRQVSEPNDAVWWIDGLTATSFKEGFGLQTPLVNGQLKTIRYYYYFERAFSTTKTLMLREGYFDAAGAREAVPEGRREEVQQSSSLDALYGVVKKDFYVITQCTGLREGGAAVEGTRLTLVAHPPEGYEFTIRTAGTPDRWRQMELELENCFAALLSALLVDPNNESGLVMRRALELFYFWVNFAPLSRGSAVCGYAALAASLLA
eukprot:gene3973-4987_t